MFFGGNEAYLHYRLFCLSEAVCHDIKENGNYSETSFAKPLFQSLLFAQNSYSIPYYFSEKQ